MKIAVFVDQFPVRSQTFVLNQITGLIDLGIDVDIIALHQGNMDLFNEGDYAQYNLLDHCVFLLAKQNSSFTKFFYRFIVSIMGLLNPKTSHKVLKGLFPSFGKQAFNLMLSAISANQTKTLKYKWIICHFGPNGVLANKLRKIGILSGNIATFFHGFDMSVEKRILGIKSDYQELFDETELILPISELWRNKLVTLGCPVDKIIIHRMGVDLSEFPYNDPEKKLGVLENRSESDCQLNQYSVNKPFVLFTVARFTEKKGLSYAIQSLSYLPKDFNFIYYLAGYGELEDELKTLTRTLQLDDKVVFCGAFNSEQIKKKMLEADVFLQPSVTAKNGDMEGVPVTLMEAMAIGVPIISTYHSGIPELITHNEHGLLVAEKDPIGIAQQVMRIAHDKALKIQIVSAARKRVGVIANNKILNEQLVNLLKK